MVTIERKKFHKLPLCLNGITFKSQSEAHDYVYLNNLERSNRISDVRFRPKFDLTVKNKKIGFYASYVSFNDIKKQQMRYFHIHEASNDLFAHLRRHFEIEYNVEVELWKSGKMI